MRPLRPACGTVAKAQLLSLLGTISASAPGVVTTQLSPAPPASSIATDVPGSSESRPATAQPPEPPPATTKSNVSVTRISPGFVVQIWLFLAQSSAFAAFLARAVPDRCLATQTDGFRRPKILK